MAVKDILGSHFENNKPEYKKRGMGTPIAEYSEAGPFSCGSCWYLQSMEPREEPKGICNEPHMTKDPKTEKGTVAGKTFAVVDKHHGCCRFIDPVKPTEPQEKFVFAGDSEEEAEEHEETFETLGEEFKDEDEPPSKLLKDAIRLHEKHMKQPKTATDASQQLMMDQLKGHLRKEMGLKTEEE